MSPRIFRFVAFVLMGWCVSLSGLIVYGAWERTHGRVDPFEATVHRIMTDVKYKDREWTVEAEGIRGLPDTQVHVTD